MKRLTVVTFLVMAACGGSGPSADAVLVVEEINETRCGEETCVTLVVTNQGRGTGSGECDLSGVGHDYKGIGVKGPIVEVPSLQPKQSEHFVRTFDLTKSQREHLLQWSASCTPGPEG